jgi:hypothetical protein
MQNRISLFIVILLLSSCAIINKNKVNTIYIKGNNKERVGVEGEKYILYVSLIKLKQHLEKAENKTKEEIELEEKLDENKIDTLTIEKAESNLVLKTSVQEGIYPAIYNILNKGEVAIYDKRKDEFVKKIQIVQVKGRYGGKQVHYKINGELFLTRLISIGE